MNIDEMVKSMDAHLATLKVDLVNLTSARNIIAGLQNGAAPATVKTAAKSGRPPHPLKGKKKSPAVIAHMRAAQRARFANERKSRTEAAPKKTAKPKKKRNLSDAGRERIRQAVIRRHAAAKAAKKAVA